MTVNPDVLARCVESVRSGRLTTEECLAAHPGIATELRDILDVAMSFAPLPPVEMDPIARARGRAALIAAMASSKPAVTQPAGQRFLPLLIATLTRLRNIMVATERLPGLFVALVIVLAATLGGGAVVASGEALPGDILYPVKLTVENAQIEAAPTDVAKAQLSLQQAANRVAEIDRLTQLGRAEAIDQAAAGYVQSLANANQQVASASSSGQNIDELATNLNGELAGQRAALETAEAEAPIGSRAALNTAALAAGRGITTRGGGAGHGLSGGSGASSGGTTPVSPTDAPPPSTTVVAVVRPTRTPEIDETEADKTRTPEADEESGSGKPSRTAEATSLPGSDDGENSGHGEGERPTKPNASTPVVPTPRARPTHPPEATEIHEPSHDGESDKTPKPNEDGHDVTVTPLARSTARPTATTTAKPTGKSDGSGNGGSDHGDGDSGSGESGGGD